MSNMLKDPAILRELIMDHYKYPRNHELVDDDSYDSRHMASDSCIDDITVQSKIENGIIKECAFVTIKYKNTEDNEIFSYKINLDDNGYVLIDSFDVVNAGHKLILNADQASCKLKADVVEN